MACNGGNFHWVESLFKKPAGGLVPEIVKGEAGQKGRIRFLSIIFAFLLISLSGAFHCFLKDPSYSHTLFVITPDHSVETTGETGEYPDGLGHDSDSKRLKQFFGPNYAFL